MRAALWQRLALYGACWAAVAGTPAAASQSLSDFLKEYPALKAVGNAVPCKTEGVSMVVLFDESGHAAALVADADSAVVRAMEEQLELNVTHADSTPHCSVRVQESSGMVAPKRRLQENTPLGALLILLKQSYYSPAELGTDGRILWSTGKRRSLDIFVPLFSESAIHAVEVKAGIRVDTFAANVLASKLGYPSDNTSDLTRFSKREHYNADEVLYYCQARDTALVRRKNAYYMGDIKGLSDHLSLTPGALIFPEIALRPEPKAEKTQQAPAAPATPTEAPKTDTPTPAAPLTPQQALKDYLRRLRKL